MTATPNQQSILIADDTPANLQLLSGMLIKSGYRPRPVPGGSTALLTARRDPPDLILLDITMPEMDGYEVCRQLKADPKLKAIPVIFISALTEAMDKVKAFGAGGVDYVTKPFQFEEVAARVETHLKFSRLQRQLEQHNLRLKELVDAQVKEISDSQMSTIFAVAKLAESRDEDTGKHLERVQSYCKLIAEELLDRPGYRGKLDQQYIANLFHASPLHDIGKVGISDNVLLKPGKLTPEEFETMKSHSGLGAQTLEAVRKKYPRNSFINMGIAIARGHHEKWNGAGYPNGQEKEDIPLCARITAIADVYDALRSKRTYKPPFEHWKSRDIIVEGSGSHFDPALVEVFTEVEIRFDEIHKHLCE